MAALNYKSVKGFCWISCLSKTTFRYQKKQYSHTSTYRIFHTHRFRYNTPRAQLSTTIVRKSISFKITELFSCAKHEQIYNHFRRNSTKNSQFTLNNEVYKEYLNSLERECKDMTDAQMVGRTLGGGKGRRLLVLRRVVDMFEVLKIKYEEIEELKQMQNEEEMKDLATKEKESCLIEIKELEQHLVDMICPAETVDECDVVLEVESGAGGQEAMLFAKEMFEMYENYARSRGWPFHVVQEDKIGIGAGGLRKGSATISGQGAFGEMKYEGGVHRVQRIPKTESKGRVHTSTISVAVLPQPSEIDIVLNQKDLQFDTYKASGAGGQHVNTTDSAVRVKHLPTGTVAECQMTRSQIKNKEIALVFLRTRIYELQLQDQISKTRNQRKIQVGNKDRSEKIRTYNFPQDRITDHRLGHNFYNLDLFMSGGDSLGNMISQLQEVANIENLQIVLEEFERTRLIQKARK